MKNPVCPGIRKAFTLVELLVVFVILAILVGLLFPVFQSIRESARQTACSNNLRQIAMATANYEASKRHFPPGTLGFDKAFDFDLNSTWLEPSSDYYWKRAQHTSVLALLLPYFGEENLYRSTDQTLFDGSRMLSQSTGFSAGHFSWFGEVEGFVSLATAKIPGFNCPSDQSESSGSNDNLIVFGGSQPVTIRDTGEDGFAWIGLTQGPLAGSPDIPAGVYDNTIDADLGLGNYLGCSGAHSGGDSPDPEKVPFTGIMSSRRPRRTHEVKDGTSHTVLFGETIGGIEMGQRRFAVSWCVGGLARMRSGIPWMLETHPRQWHWRHLGNSDNSHAFGFGSMHPHGVYFAMADGSVRPLSHQIDWFTLYQIGGMTDGEVSVSLDP